MTGRPEPLLTPCPPWCEKPAAHDWEDLWAHGLVRYHTWRRKVNDWHMIGVDEIEQATPHGTVRQRELVLDVESPTTWDLDTALKAGIIYVQALRIMHAYQTIEDGEVG